MFQKDILDIRLIKVAESFAYEQYLGLLPNQSVTRIKRYKFRKDQVLAFTSEYLKYCYIPNVLKQQGYINRVDDTIKFATNSHGKPYLVNYPQIHFNLSHTKGFVALVIAVDYNVGIDIEHIDRFSNFKQVAQAVFSNSECDILENFMRHGNNVNQAFFILWTKKEALLKAIGHGFTDSTLYLSTSLDVDLYQHISNHNASMFSRVIDSLVLSLCLIE